MTSEQSVTARAEWFVERFYAYNKPGSYFPWFWDSIASQVTVPVLRDAARILKIKIPAKTRADLREQFAAKWIEED